MKMNLLKAVLVMTFGLFATNIFAIGGGSSGGSVDRGERCAAYDHGFEEHGGGHGSCSSCLAQHGGCEMKCHSEEHECVAKGEDRDGREVVGRGHDYRSEHRARQDAEDSCYDRGGRNCYATCTTDRRLTDSYECRRSDGGSIGGGDRVEKCSQFEYLRQRPDVKNSGMTACTHFQRHGRGEGMCNPC